MSKNKKQKEEQLLRNVFAAGMKAGILVNRDHSDLDMFKQSEITEEYFQKCLEESKNFISKHLSV